MTDHIFTIERGMFGGFRLVCSCDPDEHIRFWPGSEVPLDKPIEEAQKHLLESYPQRFVTGLPS